jgi:predicted nucleic acid-binding protein
VPEPGPSDAEIDQIIQFLSPGLGSKPEGEPSPDPNDHVAMVRSILKNHHRQSSGTGIAVANEAGLFPDSAITDMPPVVIDANTLFNDVLYACSHGDQATTLLNAANAGLIRLFCARHVLEEVAEHYRRLADRKGITQQSFVLLWNRRYARLLRVVGVIPDGLLSKDESARIEELREVDPDDIPSVMLALVLQAFYLSEDGAASAAVYGERRSSEELRAWREVLMAGGDAGVLGEVFELTISVSGAMGMGVWTAFDRVTRSLPGWLRVVIAGLLLAGAGFLFYRMSDERKQSARKLMSEIGNVLVAIMGEYAVAIQRLRSAAPAVPLWVDLAESQKPSLVLVRACLHTLARTKYSARSAAELKELLPDISVPQGEAKVREVLRSNGCFTEVYPGRWQVGKPLVRMPRPHNPQR